MARRSLRPQLNQIRTWVRQGRTDAWIAHQLEVTTQQIAAFKAENELGETSGDEQPAANGEVDLRAEDEALIAKELEEEAKKAEERKQAEEQAAAEKKAAAGDDAEEDDESSAAGRTRRSRRGRRGGRGRKSAEVTFEATFDHGEEGYGLWLDPAVADSSVYAEHWAGHRPVEVTLEADQIIIRRAGSGGSGDEPEASTKDDE